MRIPTLLTLLTLLLTIPHNTFAQVTPGIDVLARRNFDLLRDKRVGVITNHTGVSRDGTHLVDLLLKNNINLVKLFSPEHGLYGIKDEKVGDMVDEKTGLPVLSLYGKTREPTAEMLQGIDVIVFDIQDVGTRFYTYISTMGLAMEAIAEHGLEIEFVVLDRPNPINGLRVEGAVSTDKYRGFTAYRSIPLVHGMTVGELAQLFNDEHKIKLTVIPMQGWTRSMYWEETGLTWINPSPNLRNPTQAILYPAIGLLESSNISVGRGTDTPFEIFGAPFIDAKAFAKALNDLKLPGLAFEPISFTPRNTHHKFNNQLCHGVRVTLTDRDAYQPARTGLSFAWLLRKMYPEQWRHDELVKMVQNDDAVSRLFALDDPSKSDAIWNDEVEAWNEQRRARLLYPE